MGIMGNQDNSRTNQNAPYNKRQLTTCWYSNRTATALTIVGHKNIALHSQRALVDGSCEVDLTISGWLRFKVSECSAFCPFFKLNVNSAELCTYVAVQLW